MAVDFQIVSARSGRMFTAIFLACVAIVGSAVLIQQTERIFPCPWCVVQRLGYMLIGAIALVAALHRPHSKGARIYSGVGVLVSLVGAGVALYQVFLELDPVRAQSCIGGTVERMLDATGVGHLLPMLLQYEGSCEATGWKLLALSIPQWSLIAYLALTATFFFTPYVVERERRAA